MRAVMDISTGRADFKQGSETFLTWYKVIKNPTTGGSDRPLIVVHGSPGMTHYYMLPLQKLSRIEGIPVIFYDQLGNGESSHCDNIPSSSWNLQTFVDELDNLIRHLGISDNFDLLGHSWGASRTPSGLKHLIISNAAADMKLMEKGLNNLLDTYPADFSRVIRRHEDEGTMNSFEYTEAITEFVHNHMCTLRPWPSELKASVLAANAHPEIIEIMMGSRTFKKAGVLKDYSIIDSLPDISCPTLLINSALDEVQDIAMQPFADKIGNIRWVKLENSSHMPMHEEPERYFTVILDFLRS
ncbi:Alpha/Beta hydrolase protein [Cyathus striatus]|nr:Alpha/Beta hydrolase protein [Cyathus striatus]